MNIEFGKIDSHTTLKITSDSVREAIIIITSKPHKDVLKKLKEIIKYNSIIHNYNAIHIVYFDTHKNVATHSIKHLNDIVNAISTESGAVSELVKIAVDLAKNSVTDVDVLCLSKSDVFRHIEPLNEIASNVIIVNENELFRVKNLATGDEKKICIKGAEIIGVGNTINLSAIDNYFFLLEDSLLSLESLDITIDSISYNCTERSKTPTNTLQEIEPFSIFMINIFNSVPIEDFDKIYRVVKKINCNTEDKRELLEKIFYADQKTYDRNNYNDMILKISKAKNSQMDMGNKKGKFTERLFGNKKNKEVFNTVEIKDDDDFDDDYCAQKSLEEFKSGITLTTWLDEIKTGGSMGLLISVNTNKLCALGYGCSQIEVVSTSNTYMPVKDYIESVLLHLEDEQNEINNAKIIKGNMIDANSIIPLYINKTHWGVARKQLQLTLGITFAHNPFGYVEKHDNYLFALLTNMNIKNINSYFGVFRTCAQVAYEKGYHKGIKKLMTDFMNDPMNRLINGQNNVMILFGQILSTGTAIVDKKGFYCRIIEEWVRSVVKPNHELLFEYVKYSDDEKHDFDENVYCRVMEKININVLEEFDRIYEIFIALQKQYNGFKRLLNIIDKNHGVIDDEMISIIKQPTKNNLQFEHYVSKKMIMATIFNCLDNGNYKDRKKLINNGKYIIIMSDVDADKLMYDVCAKYSAN